MPKWVYLVVVLVAVMAYFALKGNRDSPVDEEIGTLQTKFEDEIVVNTLRGKNALVVGGTRGIGLGVALILAKVGANAEIVGRNGENLKKIKDYAKDPSQHIDFIMADFSSVKGVHKLLDKLKSSGKLYDYLVVTTGVFPDYENPTTPEGLEKMFATNNLGRYVLFKHWHKFMNPNGNPRVVNVLSSGKKNPTKKIERDGLIGKTNYSNAIEQILHMAALNELINLHLAQKWKETNVQIIGIHPGLIFTDLTKGMFIHHVLANPIVQFCLGFISDEKVGENIAVMLSDKKIKKKLSLFDEKLIARQVPEEILQLYKNEGEWFIQYMDSLEEKLK